VHLTSRRFSSRLLNSEPCQGLWKIKIWLVYNFIRLMIIIKTMIYRESLPENCPPIEADELNSRREVYRLVCSNPPQDDDFRSQREMKPSAVFKNISECQAMGLSVFSNRDVCHKTMKLPAFKKCQHYVCRVVLDKGAGRIQQTGQLSHHTWWPLADFDILASCNADVS